MVYPFNFLLTKAKERGDPWPAAYRIKTINDVLELLVTEGFEGMADAMSVLLNEAMRL
ncbi:MAG: hypothetical protein V3R56_05685 [Xanthomonadales bacterium]